MAHMSLVAKLIGAVVALAPMAGATDPRLLELVMPDAHIVFGFDLTRVRTSPMGEMFRAGMQTGMQQATGGKELQALFGQMGFNPFEDIQELIVATTGAGKNPPTLVAMRGSGRLRSLMESQGMKSKTGADSTAVFGDVLVAGDAAQVKAAKVRHGHGAKLNSALAQRIAELSGKYDLWLISNVPVAKLAENMDQSKAQGLGNMEMLKSIDQFSVGMGLSADFALQLEAVAHDEKSAGSLADSLKMLMAFAQQGAAGKDPATADALKRIEFGVQGRVLRVGITVPAEEMKKQMEMVRAQAAASPASAPTSAPTPRATARRAPASTDIVIQSSPKDMGNVVITVPKK